MISKDEVLKSIIFILIFLALLCLHEIKMAKAQLWVVTDYPELPFPCIEVQQQYLQDLYFIQEHPLGPNEKWPNSAVNTFNRLAGDVIKPVYIKDIFDNIVHNNYAAGTGAFSYLSSMTNADIFFQPRGWVPIQTYAYGSSFPQTGIFYEPLWPATSVYINLPMSYTSILREDF